MRVKIDMAWFCRDGNHTGDTAPYAGREGIVKYAFCPVCLETTKHTAERTGGNGLVEGTLRVDTVGRCL